MNKSEFWRLIESSKRGSHGGADAQVENLKRKLSTLPEKEIITFDQILERCIAQTYDSNLQAAAYLILDGGSEDAFDYFRGCLYWVFYV